MAVLFAASLSLCLVPLVRSAFLHSSLMPTDPILTSASSHVMSAQQLNPHPMLDMDMQMPMMMPMPITTALQKHMKKSMQAMTTFMSQMQVLQPNLFAMSPAASSPCGGGSSADIMSMIQQLTQQLNPMNLLNSVSSMLKGTQMAMGMGNAGQPCANFAAD